MADPEVKILRDETASLIAETKNRDKMISEMASRMEEMAGTIAEQRLELEAAKRKLAYYENPHSAPAPS